MKYLAELGLKRHRCLVIEFFTSDTEAIPEIERYAHITDRKYIKANADCWNAFKNFSIIL